MDKVKMTCDRCGKTISVGTADVKETEAKQPFYRCPECHIGSLKTDNKAESEN